MSELNTNDALSLRDTPAIGPEDVAAFEEGLTARQLLILTTIERDAFDEGFDEGYAKGYELGVEEERHAQRHTGIYYGPEEGEPHS